MNSWNTWNVNQYSTNNVGTAFNVTSFDIVTRGTKSFLYVWGFLQLVHSAPPASVSIGLFVSYSTGGGAGLYICNYDPVLVNSATIYTPFHLSGMLDLSTKTASGAFQPGKRSIGVDLKNNTAGTVTSAPTGGFATYLNVNSLEVPYVGGTS